MYIYVAHNHCIFSISVKILTIFTFSSLYEGNESFYLLASMKKKMLKMPF